MHLNMHMARYWPHESRIQVRDREQLWHILSWMKSQHGDVAYQHWTSEYSHPWLCIRFCDVHMKAQFDLTWG